MLKSIKSLKNRFVWFSKNYRRIHEFSKLDDGTLSRSLNGPVSYATDGLITSNNADYIKDTKFAKAYAAAAATNPWDGFTLQWRVYIVCWFAQHVKNLEGDFIECGVNTGAYARAVIDYINFNSTGKVFYLFDTFEGFPDQQITVEEEKLGINYYGGDHYKNVYEQVTETFAPFNVKIIKGMVPVTLSECKAEKIAYLSIDMNAVAPEIVAVNFFWDKIVPGGVVILDDYGFPMHISQKHAFDKFASDKGLEVLSLPTGQGIIIKK